MTYVLVTISEVEVIERDDSEGKQDVRTGVATATEIIRDNGEYPCGASIMAARAYTNAIDEEKPNPKKKINQKTKIWNNLR